MMKQVCTLLACLMALSAPAQAAAARPFLWRVDVPGSTQPDYLFGTMHVPASAGVGPRVEKALKASNRFVMEVDLQNGDVPALLGRYSQLPAGESLPTLVGATHWPKLVELMAPRGFPADRLEHLQPWFVGLAFLPTPTDEGPVIDDRLRDLADDARIPVTFLESADDQFRALDRVTMKEDVAQLLELVNDPASPADEMAKLQAAYQAGDQATVETFLFEGDKVKNYPDFYEQIFYRRNATWQPKVEAMMQKDRTFVAVGLGHLIGTRGLIAGLRRKGWKVTREG